MEKLVLAGTSSQSVIGDQLHNLIIMGITEAFLVPQYPTGVASSLQALQGPWQCLMQIEYGATINQVLRTHGAEGKGFRHTPVNGEEG